MEDSYGIPSQEPTSTVREINKHEQRIAKAERELELRVGESASKAKQYKLKAKASERTDVYSFLLEHFDQELSALQEGKPGFL